MNIALSAVIISILLIPPVIFYLSFYLGKYPRAIPKFSLLEGILGTAIIALFIHAIAIYTIPYEIRFDILLKLLGGELKDLEKKTSNGEFNNAITSFARYNICLLFIMVLLGRLTRKVLLWTNWHANFPILNLYNKWWYVFNGYYNNIEETDLIFVDVVVDTKDRTVIYSGFLINFDFVNGELERLYLRDTLKRGFIKGGDADASEETTPTTKPSKIPGDLFSIAYRNILNINIHFISIDNTIEEIEQLPDEDA